MALERKVRMGRTPGDDKKIIAALKDKTNIISPATADLIVGRMAGLLGPQFLEMSGNFGVDAGKTARAQPLFEACKAAREKKGWTIKEISARLKVPQYRLKAAEGESGLSSIKVEILQQYVGYLGLRGRFAKWKKSNGDIYRRWERGGADLLFQAADRSFLLSFLLLRYGAGKIIIGMF